VSGWSGLNKQPMDGPEPRRTLALFPMPSGLHSFREGDLSTHSKTLALPNYKPLHLGASRRAVPHTLA
jgi:hypothetical protein